MPSKFSVRDKEIDAAGYGYEVNYDYRGANLTEYRTPARRRHRADEHFALLHRSDVVHVADDPRGSLDDTRRGGVSMHALVLGLIRPGAQTVGGDTPEQLHRRVVDHLRDDAERRRIAADLHDGVVQELAGASFALAAAAKRMPEAPAVSASLDRVAAGVRQSMRSLRSLLVEIYPPNLHTEGLAAALGDLLAPLPGSGLSTSLEVPEELNLQPDVAAMIFRVAQEAVRNTQRHAGATVLSVHVQLTPERVSLVVEDNGIGFDPRKSADEGHVGLRLLNDLAVEAGGSFDVRTSPGAGTRVSLEVPR